MASIHYVLKQVCGDTSECTCSGVYRASIGYDPKGLGFKVIRAEIGCGQNPHMEIRWSALYPFFGGNFPKNVSLRLGQSKKEISQACKEWPSIQQLLEYIKGLKEPLKSFEEMLGYPIHTFSYNSQRLDPTTNSRICVISKQPPTIPKGTGKKYNPPTQFRKLGVHVVRQESGTPVLEQICRECSPGTMTCEGPGIKDKPEDIILTPNQIAAIGLLEGLFYQK